MSDDHSYLMGELVSDHYSHSLPAGGRIGVLVVQQSSLPVGDQPPILHSSHSKVRNGKQIWEQRQSINSLLWAGTGRENTILYTSKF